MGASQCAPSLTWGEWISTSPEASIHVQQVVLPSHKPLVVQQVENQGDVAVPNYRGWRVCWCSPGCTALAVEPAEAPSVTERLPILHLSLIPAPEERRSLWRQTQSQVGLQGGGYGGSLG